LSLHRDRATFSTERSSFAIERRFVGSRTAAHISFFSSQKRRSYQVWTVSADADGQRAGHRVLERQAVAADSQATVSGG
jgi:hypothetical protein